MKVTETIKKEFKPYKMSIKSKRDKFILEYWVRFDFVSVTGRSDYIAHTEEFDTLQDALDKFNDTIEEIK